MSGGGSWLSGQERRKAERELTEAAPIRVRVRVRNESLQRLVVMNESLQRLVVMNESLQRLLVIRARVRGAARVRVRVRVRDVIRVRIDYNGRCKVKARLGVQLGWWLLEGCGCSPSCGHGHSRGYIQLQQRCELKSWSLLARTSSMGTSSMGRGGAHRRGHIQCHPLQALLYATLTPLYHAGAAPCGGHRRYLQP